MGDERFASLTADDLQSILENRDSANTKNVIQAARRIVYDYSTAKDLSFDELILKPKANIAEFLINFYAEVRKKNGQLYSRQSMISIRFGIQRFFQAKRKFDVINDEEFRLPNEMFKAVLTEIKRSGKGTVTHKEIISEADIDKLFKSNIVSVNNPQGLQYKIFLDVMFYTCRRGRENLRCMKKTDFIMKADAQGRRYYVNVAKYETKNHRGSDMNDHDTAAGRIYEIPGNPRCPVSSLEKYLAKLNSTSDCFWQRPRRHFKESDASWYDNMAVGHNSLGNFMKTISTKAQLSQIYTNHCIRATCITALDNKGVEARHIMSISGHKSENSLKSYPRNVSEEKRHEMCTVLQNVLNSPTDVAVVNNADDLPEAVPLKVSSEQSPLTEVQNVVQNCGFEVQELNDGDFLSEILDLEKKEWDKENSIKKHLSIPGQIRPLFQNVKLVQIHYHVQGN